MSAIACTVHWPEPRTVGDTARFFRVTVVNDDGLPIDLGGTTVTFKLVNKETGAVVVNELPAIIGIGDDLGNLTYEPLDADVANVGHFLGRFKVVTSEGDVLKLGVIEFEIVDDV